MVEGIGKNMREKIFKEAIKWYEKKGEKSEVNIEDFVNLVINKTADSIFEKINEDWYLYDTDFHEKISYETARDVVGEIFDDFFGILLIIMVVIIIIVAVVLIIVYIFVIKRKKDKNNEKL